MSLKSRFWQPELVMSISAIFISFIAVGVALFEANLAREQQRSAVWPHLEVAISNVDRYVRSAANRGIGPALIEDVRVTVDGEPLFSWSDYLAEVDADYEWTFVQSNINRRVISPGERIDYFDLSETSFEWLREVASQADSNSFNIRTEICYCSVFGDCWITSGFTSEPIPQCLRDDKFSFPR